jgi:hypothetical protein
VRAIARAPRIEAFQETIVNLLSFLPRTAALATALAAATPLLAPAVATAAPTVKRFIDEATWHASIADSGEGYRFSFRGWVNGVTSPTDALRFDLVQKGKVIASMRCKIQPAEGDKLGWAECTSDTNKVLTATGALALRVVYIDDQTETEEVIRTFQWNVVAYDPGRGNGEVDFALMGDDLLGAGYAFHRSTKGSGGDAHDLEIYLWTAGALGAGTYQLRCTVDGKRLADIDTYVGTEGEFGGSVLKNNEITSYTWARAHVIPRELVWGTTEQVAKAYGNRTPPLAMGAHPGDWSCDLRSEGKVQRTFKFPVGADGRIQAHPSESAPGAPPLMAGEAVIDVYLGKDARDVRIRPDAIRKSHSFGLAWAKNERTDAVLKALPKASGHPDLKPAKAKKSKK